MKKYLEKINLLKINYKGEKIPAGAGILFALVGIIGWSYYLLTGVGDANIIQSLIFLSMIISLVGLLDDMAGTKKYQGFTGHFKGIIQGHFTTGALKAVVAFFTILLLLMIKGFESKFLLFNLTIILLMTNFFNLLDLRPGRSLKLFIILTCLLPFNYILYIIPVLIITGFYLPFELKSRVMLGDSGANLLGVITGYLYILAFGNFFKIILLVLLIMITVLAEKYSLTKIIEANQYLNWFDQLGRK